MRFSINAPARGVKTRYVLILQGETAFWFKIVDERVIAYHTEYLLSDCLERRDHCPWISSSESEEPVQVELVLDTTLDEVDRVSVEHGNNALVNRYRTFMTLARLRRDYSRAKVYALPAGAQASVAALMHPAISEQWASWLLMLQTMNLVFHRVLTGTELAAHWSQHFHDPRLLIMRVADYERHLLVHQGAVLFLRTVLVGNSGNVAEEDRAGEIGNVQSVVAQSIEYLNAVVTGDAHDIAIMQPRCTTEAMAEISGALSDSDYPDYPVAGSVSVLLAMLLELDINLTDTVNGVVVEKENAVRVDLSLDKYQNLRENIELLWRRCLDRLPTRKKLAVDCWPLRTSALRWLNALEPSVRYMQASRRVACVFAVSVVFAAVAVGAASSALINGVASKRLIYRDDVQQTTINDVEAKLYASAAGMSFPPAIAADSLYVADSLLSSVLVDSEFLLGEIATAVTAVSGIQVDRLVWAQANGEELYESLTHSLNSLPSQSSVEFVTTHATLQLELSGKVSGETLKEQQVLLKEFVGELWRVPGAHDVQVLESPVDNALSSTSDLNSRGRYRVTLVLRNQK